MLAPGESPTAPTAGEAWFVHDEAATGRLVFAAAEPAPGQPAGAPVEFALPRTCIVALRDAAGQPLAGAPACLQLVGVPDAIVRRTGADGDAVFPGLPAVAVQATLDDDPSSATGMERVLGTADLGPGDARIVAALTIGVRVRAEVIVDGVPGLPGELAFGCRNGWVGNTTEDPTHGVLHFDVHPLDAAEPCHVLLYGPWRYSVGTATIAAGGTTAAVEFRLDRHHEAHAEVTPPVDGQLQLFVERLFPGGQSSIWSHVPAGRQADALPRFTNLQAGRYRLRDALSDVCGDEVEVGAGGVARLRLDLSRVVAVSGRVTVAAGERPQNATLELSDGQGKVVRRSPLAPDGSFVLRLVVDRADLRLAVVAGGRRSAPVPVTGPAADIVLLLP